MRVMITGSDNPNVLASFYARHLVDFPVTLEKLKYYDHYYSSISKNIPFKILYRLYPEYFYRQVDKIIIQQVDAFKPDIVWIFKGMPIMPSTLKKIKDKNIKLVNYNADHPFRFASRGSGNKNVVNSIPLYDLHISYSRRILNDLEAKYPCVTAFLPFGFELDESVYEKIAKETEEKQKVCFLGNPDPRRAALIKSFSANGIPIDVYGYDWENWLEPNHNLEIFGPLKGIDYYRTLRSYRVQLNVFRDHNLDSHNMRTFEVPAVGGIQLAPDSLEHRQFFRENEEIFLYSDESECIKKAGYLLGLSEKEARDFRLKAREISVEGKYSYKDRAKEAFYILKNLFEES